MPTKHIDEETWQKIESQTVQATIVTKRSVKDSEMLKWLILKGLEHIKESDYEAIARRKK